MRFDELADDPVMPAQFYGDRALNAYQRLHLAVLRDAMRCLQGVGIFDGPTEDRPGMRLRHQQAARAWITRPDDWGVFSFISVCGVLHLDADFSREKLLGDSLGKIPRNGATTGYGNVRPQAARVRARGRAS